MSNVSEYIEVIHRELPYSSFDADNHMYETREALTKFVPREYEGVIKYVDIDGRTKLALNDKISDYIPNPTFNKVAVPGGAGYDVTKGKKESGFGNAGLGFEKMVAMPSADAFFDPEPRLELMMEMGIDRTLLWPTLASALEERLADDPDAVVAVIHALNEWMHEHWSYVYSDALYATPIISLAAGNQQAIDELEFVADRGAKIFSSGWRRYRPGRAANPSLCPSSILSGSASRSWASSSACIQETRATTVTSMNGKVSRER